MGYSSTIYNSITTEQIPLGQRTTEKDDRKEPM